MVEEAGKHGGGEWEHSDFVVFLGGSTVQVRVEGKDSYESLAAKVDAKVSIPERHWYRHLLGGRDLRHVLCPTSLLQRDSTVRMHSRLLDVVPLSAPLMDSGFVQHVIVEDAGLLVELASVAWHRDQRKAPLCFSLSQGGAIRGNGGALGREPERRPPAPPNTASGPDGGSSSSPNTSRRQPQPSSNRSDAISILELLKGVKCAC